MRALLVALALLLLLSVSPAQGQVHEVPLLGDTYYVEERPVPNIENGFEEIVFDASLWIYRESNFISGLQRGGIGLMGDYFSPGCDQGWTFGDLTTPCTMSNEDPINDENYGWGPDQIIIAFPWRSADAVWFEVDPPGTTLVPVGLGGSTGTILGCAGTVQLTPDPGGSFPFYGVRVGSGACDAGNAPCETYDMLPGITCSGNPAACCTTLYEPAVPGAEIACITSTNLRFDVNKDGFWDLVVPAATVTGPPC